MKLTTEQISELKKEIDKLIVVLYNYKLPYLDMIFRGGMEQAISFHIGLYMYKYIKKRNWLKGYDIDMEYNKNGDMGKVIPSRPNGARPDIIIHQRGLNDWNVLMIEVKGWWNKTSRDNDRDKLRDFTDQQGEYKYGLGVFLDLRNTGCTPEYFQDY